MYSEKWYLCSCGIWRRIFATQILMTLNIAWVSHINHPVATAVLFNIQARVLIWGDARLGEGKCCWDHLCINAGASTSCLSSRAVPRPPPPLTSAHPSHYFIYYFTIVSQGLSRALLINFWVVSTGIVRGVDCDFRFIVNTWVRKRSEGEWVLCFPFVRDAT